MLTLLRNLVVMLWVCAGTYLGLAGYFGTKLFETTSNARISGEARYLVYGGLSFKTRQDLADFLLDETVSQWFSWLPDVPADLMPFLACSTWGILGAALRLVHSRVRGQRGEELTWEMALFTPILGAGVAVSVYLLAFLLPAVLTVGPQTMRAETIVALSLVSGIGCERVYQWVQEQIEKLTS